MKESVQSLARIARVACPFVSGGARLAQSVRLRGVHISAPHMPCESVSSGGVQDSCKDQAALNKAAKPGGIPAVRTDRVIGSGCFL